MNRRRFLVASGLAATAGAAGCLRGEGAPAAEYPTESHQGQTVPLAPLADVYEWFEADEARFVDTRGKAAYEESHVPGAVHSTGPDGFADDPTDDWDRTERIVTYCDCPHTLAVQRASALLADGFETVYALDDGFGAWEEAGYPVDALDDRDDVAEYRVEGRTDPDHAGGYVWLRDGDDPVEVGEVADDGTWAVTIRTTRLGPESTLEVETPERTFDATLEELTDGDVDDADG